MVWINLQTFCSASNKRLECVLIFWPKRRHLIEAAFIQFWLWILVVFKRRGCWIQYMISSKHISCHIAIIVISFISIILPSSISILTLTGLLEKTDISWKTENTICSDILVYYIFGSFIFILVLMRFATIWYCLDFTEKTLLFPFENQYPMKKVCTYIWTW